MSVRVETYIGKKPVIIVAPHGPNDINTDVIAEQTIESLSSYGVINRGFERSDIVDTQNDKANCNRVDHIKEPVVYDEFLRPIIKYKDLIKRRILKAQLGSWGWRLPGHNDDKVLVFYVHGVGDNIHKIAGEDVGCIVGYGLGQKKDSLTCEMWRKNLFVAKWNALSTLGEAFEGKGAGKYAGRSTNNLNQYFARHEGDPWVDCMQIEMPYSSRKTKSRAKLSGILLAAVIEEMLDQDEYTLQPTPKFL